MAYQVDRFNGTFLTSVGDGTVDRTTDLRLVGKNYAGYGELQNENFVHLLENFANTTPPPKAITGQLWYDSGTKKIKFYDGVRFKAASGAEVGNLAPPNMQPGEFWFDTTTDQLYTWNGTGFVLIGPENAPEFGTSGAITSIVKDTLGNSRAIVKLQSEDKVVAIVNGSTDDFTLDNSINPIVGFSVVKRGITLVNTDSNTGITTDNHYFWGTSSNALTLDGFSASDFVRTGNTAFNQVVAFNDSGFTVGDQNDLRVRVENGDETVIENRLGNPITLRIRMSSADIRNIAIFSEFGIVPGIGNSYTLGNSVNTWSSVYANSLFGNLTGNVIGNTEGSHKGNVLAVDDSVIFDASSKSFIGNVGLPDNLVQVYGNLIGNVTGTATNALNLNGIEAALSGTPNTIPLRDGSANIIANRLIGTSDRSDRLKIDNDAQDSDPLYRSAKTNPIPNTIVARDLSGNLSANILFGTATSARYADLAEKYLTDEEYGVGTVVMVGGEKEVTACISNSRAIGVVSANPAFMMNRDLEGGTYIALKGRVPVKILGPVSKGDKLIAGPDGLAIVTKEHSPFIFAIALETNNMETIKLVEAVVL
jgi:hypothetical protein